MFICVMVHTLSPPVRKLSQEQYQCQLHSLCQAKLSTLKSCFVPMPGISSRFKITFLMRQNGENFVKAYKTVISSSQFKILCVWKIQISSGKVSLNLKSCQRQNSNANFISQRISKEISLRFLNYRNIPVNVLPTKIRSPVFQAQ